jgi:uncharacterized protein (TIGR00369 family)
MTNQLGSMHGGAIASLADTLTTIAHTAAVVIQEMDAPTTVSAQLSVEYHSPAPVGKEVCCRCFVNKAGRTLAFLSADFVSPDGSKIYARVNHIKALVSRPLTSSL